MRREVNSRSCLELGSDTLEKGAGAKSSELIDNSVGRGAHFDYDISMKRVGD